MIKLRKRRVIKHVILFAFGLTLLMVFDVLFILAFDRLSVDVNVTTWASFILATVIAAALTILLYKYPEWYVVDFVGVCVAAAVAAILGISLSILPVFVLLIMLAIYDAISVYKTKHMITLADAVTQERLPVLLVVPTSKGYSFLKQKSLKEQIKKKEKREAVFMGLGDIAIPGVLVVSAFSFLGMVMALFVLQSACGHGNTCWLSCWVPHSNAVRPQGESSGRSSSAEWRFNRGIRHFLHDFLQQLHLRVPVVRPFMRILVVGDIHGSDSSIRQTHSWIEELEPDLLIVLGDITHFGPVIFAVDFLEGLEVKTLALPGNTDPISMLEALDELEVNLHHRKVQVDDEIFVGFGASDPTPFDTLFELPDSEIYDSLTSIMEENVVLVTHAPPYGILDTVSGYGHVGSKAVRRIIDEFRPKLAIFGHIHEARGVQPGETTFLNPGAARSGYGAIVDMDKNIDIELLG